MTGRDRRQTRQLVSAVTTTKPKTNRTWEAPEAERATAPSTDVRPLTVEFVALRLLEAIIRKEGRTALCNEAALDCAATAKNLLRATGTL